MLKNYILCPVCGKHKFPAFEDNGTCICPFCGWEHDSSDEENPFELCGPNDLCLNDYKLRYEYYTEQNPDYYWKRDKYPELPQIEPMLCPVCQKYRFEELSLEDIWSGITPENAECKMCGWHYDLSQLENPDKQCGANVLSLNEYKAQYKKKLAENPDYNYFDEKTDNYKPQAHICPVCGKYEFSDISSNEICPFCGWEDDKLMEDEPDSWAGCANDLCLNDFIERYKLLTQKKSDYKFAKDKFME